MHEGSLPIFDDELEAKKCRLQHDIGPWNPTWYPDEFYKAFNIVVRRGVPISSEWSGTKDDRVDFQIPEKKWAVELLRDHSRVDEHISRFKEGRKYHIIPG